MNAIQPCSRFLNFSAPNSSISALLSFRYFSLGLAALAVVASVMIFAHALCSGALRAALTRSRLSRFQAAYECFGWVGILFFDLVEQVFDGVEIGLVFG